MTEDIFYIDLGQLLSSLSYVLDVAENRYFGHSKRTAYISYSIGEELGLNEEDLTYTYYAALIHDIGMAGQLAKYSVEEIHLKKELKKAHCQLGYDIINTLPINKNIAKYILYHHEKWDGTGIYKLEGSEIPIPSQIIHIADYFELFFLRKYGRIKKEVDKTHVKNWVKKSKGNSFNKDIGDAFLSVIEKEKFWYDLLPINILEAIDLLELKKNILIDIDDLKKISEAFSILIDSKSKFTYEHSQGISKLAKKFSTYLGYSPSMVKKIEIAANLHDIGKFVIPNSILEKPGKLTKKEFNIIKIHPYYTKIALKQIEGLEDIAEWAGNHHERLNGKGYPEKLNYKTITQEDQIIALSDIYQALTEDRPYRKGMRSSEALKIMEAMARENYISEKLFLDFKNVI